MTRYSILVLTLLFQVIFIFFLDFAIFISRNVQLLYNSFFLINLLMIAATVMTIMSLSKIREFTMRETDMKIANQNLKNIEEMLKMQQVQRHDHLNHIQTLQSMLFLEEYNAAKDYVGGITSKYVQTNRIVRLGNPALTALINVKVQAAQSLNIDFNFTVDATLEHLKIESWDLCSVVGNLLDNAIEYLVSLPEKQRVIHFKTEKTSSGTQITVQNPLIHEVDLGHIFEMGYSTKNQEGRGFGLYIVQKIVRKYNGNIEAQLIEGTEEGCEGCLKMQLFIPEVQA